MKHDCFLDTGRAMCVVKIKMLLDPKGKIWKRFRVKVGIGF